VGTDGYSSIEIIRRQKNYTTAVDMFAVGCIVYYMVMGVPPFDTDISNSIEKVKELDDKVELGHFEFLPAVPFSQNGKDFITHLLAKHPKERMTASEALNHSWIRDKYKRRTVSPLRSPDHKRFSSNRDTYYPKSKHTPTNYKPSISPRTCSPYPKPCYEYNQPLSYDTHFIEEIPIDDYSSESSSRSYNHYPFHQIPISTLVDYNTHWDSLKPFHNPAPQNRYPHNRVKYSHNRYHHPYELPDYDKDFNPVEKYNRKTRNDWENKGNYLKRTYDELSESCRIDIRQRRKLENVVD